MTGFCFLCNLVLVFHACASLFGQTEAVVWRVEQNVNFYEHYTSVSPVRFLVPPLTGEATWSFRATKNPDKCDHETIGIFLQFGSLPLVNPLNETYPDHFYLERTNAIQLAVKSDNASINHTVLFPLSGDWYAAAVIPESDHQITQKGLTTACEYMFSASLELEELPPHQYLSLNRDLKVPLTSDEADGIWIGFTVPTSSRSLQLNAKDCSLNACEVQLSTLDDESGQMTTKNCSHVDNATCSLLFPTPRLGSKRYIRVKLLTEGNASLVVNVESEACLPLEESSNSSQACVLERKLDRYQKTGDFSVDFVRLENDTVRANEYVLSNESVTVVPFVVERTTDIGGTLSVKVSFKKDQVAEEQNVRVCGQVGYSKLPSLAGDLDLCSNASNSFQVNSSTAGDDKSVSGGLYVPYPEEGWWTLALGLQCYNATNGSSDAVACRNGTQQVTVTVKVEDCVDKCGGHGYCRSYIKGSDFIVFATCDCSAGWRGYGCTDGREAFSDTSQLVEVLLLTLSNLFFIPAFALALYRRYYLEAVVYFYNMFASTFYHACDGDRIEQYTYCLTKYSVLSISDFLASTVSLWVTLVAMAQVRMDFASAVQMAGPLALMVGVLLDRHSLWLIATPVCTGLALVLVCWVFQCFKTKRCFPEKRQYLWMMPGVLFAACGAVVFAFFETTKNYKYTHSAWHVCLSLSIVFLLPPHRKEKVNTSVNFDDTESTEGLVLGPNNYTRRLNFEL